MTREELLLVTLMEECDEISQRAAKALRFGLNEVQEGQNLNNAQRLIYEFNDLIGVMELLHADKSIPYHIDAVASGLKKIKVEKWLKYSAECGTLNQQN